MAESVVYFVLERLHSLLIDEARFLDGVKDQVEELQIELERMRCFLKDADARQDENVMIRNWVSEIRELALDIEDVLEMYAFKIPLKRDNSVIAQLFGIFKGGSTTLHQVGLEIQLIKTKISGLITSMKSYGIRCNIQGESSRNWRINRSYYHFVDQDFVGLEKDVDNLATHLVNNCHRVVSICGMGGLGKSTIAKKVFHHRDVRQHFQAFAWASISNQWQAIDVMEGILTKLSPEKRDEIAKLKEDELLEELYNIQKMKKCLIVLDDIWSMEFWDYLKAAFPDGRSGSTIILTSRKRDVALHVDPTCYLYQPRFLNAEESWELLCKKAFPRQILDQDPIVVNANIEKIGREMVVQCRGLPLAIIVVGGLMLTKSEVNEWEEVYHNLKLYLRKGREIGEYGMVHNVLALSYHDLPYNLKPCFLHLGNFPEDYKIPARKLIQMWAAEGFVPINSRDDQHEEEELTMMDIGERYLSELAQRCMVQLQVDHYTGRLKSCCLHDLMRDVCLLKGKEENFLRIISHEPTGAPENGAIRRLSVTVGEDIETYFPPHGEKIEGVRSAIFLSKLAYRKVFQSSLIQLCNIFLLLRVLELEKFNFRGKVPKAIGNLICLRFMSFKGSQFGKLSSALGKLKYLQTLDLRVDFFSSLTMPDVIWKLQRLRHLYLPPVHGNVNKLQIGSLSKLETLKNFDTRVYDVRDLLKLNNLRKLAAILMLHLDDLERIIGHLIDNNSNRLRESSFLIRYNFITEKELTLLTQLLGCHHLRKLDLNGEIRELPDYHNFSLSLTTLTLRRSGIEEDPMPILEKLPGLHTLSLRGNAFSGKKMKCSPQGFPQLTKLQFEGLLNWKKWKVEKGAMPNLVQLEIDGCIKLKMLPDGLRFITTIKELVIANMPEPFKRRLKVFNDRKGEDLDKVELISSVLIRVTSKDSKKHFQRQQTGNSFSGLFQNITPSLMPTEWRTI